MTGLTGCRYGTLLYQRPVPGSPFTPAAWPWWRLHTARPPRSHRIDHSFDPPAGNYAQQQSLLIRCVLVVEFRLVAAAPRTGVIGLWRSLVAHLTGGQGVASSNLASPTEFGLVGAISHGPYLVRSTPLQ